MATKNMLAAATATGAGVPVTLDGPDSTFQAFGTTSAGAGAATIVVEVSNDGVNWITAGTFNLTLSTTAAVDGFTMQASWPFARGNVTAISGTGASVNLSVGQ